MHQWRCSSYKFLATCTFYFDRYFPIQTLSNCPAHHFATTRKDIWKKFTTLGSQWDSVIGKKNSQSRAFGVFGLRFSWCCSEILFPAWLGTLVIQFSNCVKVRSFTQNQRKLTWREKNCPKSESVFFLLLHRWGGVWGLLNAKTVTIVATYITVQPQTKPSSTSLGGIELLWLILKRRKVLQ